MQANLVKVLYVVPVAFWPPADAKAQLLSNKKEAPCVQDASDQSMLPHLVQSLSVGHVKHLGALLGRCPIARDLLRRADTDAARSGKLHH